MLNAQFRSVFSLGRVRCANSGRFFEISTFKQYYEKLKNVITSFEIYYVQMNIWQSEKCKIKLVHRFNEL